MKAYACSQLVKTITYKHQQQREMRPQHPLTESALTAKIDTYTTVLLLPDCVLVAILAAGFPQKMRTGLQLDIDLRAV